jgi:hypothetical protein
VWVALAIILSLGWNSWAQRDPRAGYIYPAGGRQGTAFSVKVGGQFLDGVTNVYVSGDGVRASVLEHTKPLTQRQLNDLRERLEVLQRMRSGAGSGDATNSVPTRSTNATPVMNRAAVNQEIAELRTKLAASRRQANPQIAETVALLVVVATNAEPGQREIRLGTPNGVSNPIAFFVGRLPEFGEKEPNDKVVDAGTRRPLPSILNGQILQGDIDRYRFQARRGQRLVISVNARELIPFLADAVPGWFQAILALYDADGQELAFVDDYQFRPDPILCHEITKDGDYILEIRDAVYRGREDFVYRITAGELPFVTGHFPLGKRVGTPVAVVLQGWNLPMKEFVVGAENETLGIQTIHPFQQQPKSNPVPFAVDNWPEILDAEPNNQQSNAQEAVIPLIINGRIDTPGDRDVFRFQGKAGMKIVAEVYARRLDSPLDSVLRLTDADGRELIANDDQEDKAAGLVTHHADSRFCVTLPVDGPYFLHMSDAQRQGGPVFGYRLRLSQPRPDFELRVVPSSINARPGMSVPISVYALRKDGFSGDILLALKDAPKGFQLSGGWVPGTQDHIRLTLAVPPVPGTGPFRLVLEGRSLLDGREIRRMAIPAEDMMQAFIYHHLVPSKEWMIAVNGPRRSGPLMKLADESPVRIPAGGIAKVRVLVPSAGGRAAEPVHLEPGELPPGIDIRSVSTFQGGLLIELGADAQKITPGAKGNVLVNAFVTRSGTSKNDKTPRERRRTAIGTVPAIPYEVVATVQGSGHD